MFFPLTIVECLCQSFHTIRLFQMERRRQSLSSKPSKASLTGSASYNQLSSLGAGEGGRAGSGSPTPRSVSPQPQTVQDGANSNCSEPITTGQIVCLLCDARRLEEKVGRVCSNHSGTSAFRPSMIRRPLLPELIFSDVFFKVSLNVPPSDFFLSFKNDNFQIVGGR